jgi:hypothetical protein
MAQSKKLGQKEIRLLGLFGVILVFFEAKVGFASRQDLVESLSSVGAGGVFIQSVEISNHFAKYVEEEGSYFLKKYWEQDPETHPLRKENLPLSYNLGFGYSLSSSPPARAGRSEIRDQIGSTSLGILWEVSPKFEAGLKTSFDYSPEENYSHGAARFRFEYTVYLKSLFRSKKTEKAISKYNTDDAGHYYRREHVKRMEELERAERSAKSNVSRAPASMAVPTDPDAMYERHGDEDINKSEDERDQYPNIKIAYNLGFDQHHVGPKTLRSGSPLASEQVLSQFLNGVELTCSPSVQWSLRFGFNLYRYTGSVDSLLSAIESSFVSHLPTRYPSYGTSSSFTNQYLTLPDHTFEESIDWFINERDSLSLNLNQTIYAASNLSYSFAINPIYYRELGKRWKLGLIMNAILGSLVPSTFSGSLSVNYKL